MRKSPRQLRSQQMVQSLIDATAQVVSERGLAQTTTNHIASCAGVSVGSLYQYFATKDALIDALADRMGRELMLALDQRIQSQLDDDLPTLTRAALHTVFDYFEAHRALYLELARNWAEPRMMRTVEGLERYLIEAFRLYLLRHHRDYRFENLPGTLFIVFNATVFTGMRYMAQPPALLTRERLIDGLTVMVTDYLLKTGGVIA